MTINKHQKLIDHLKGLSGGDFQPIQNSSGLCFEIEAFLVLVECQCITSSLFHNLTHIFKGWDKCSDNAAYPVKSPNKTINSEFYYDRMYTKGCNIWSFSTKYGTDRRDLCAYTAKFLEDNPDYTLID